MADDFDTSKDNSLENNKEISADKNKLTQFRDSLSSLAAEVKDASRNAFDKGLQSLDKWLSLQEKSVQKEVVEDLNTLRSHVTISENTERVGGKSPEVASSDPLYRPSSVDKEIIMASGSVSAMIEQSDQDAHPIASVIGSWMKKIMQTES